MRGFWQQDPEHFLLPLVPVIVGSAIAYGNGKMHFWAALAALMAALLIQIGTNFANDVFDLRKETIPGKEPALTGNPSRTFDTPPGPAGTGLAFGLAMLIGLYLVFVRLADSSSSASFPFSAAWPL